MQKNNQKIPEGWSVKKGKDISSLITKGASPKWQGFEYCDSGTLFVTSENVRDGFLDISNPKFLPNAFSEKQKRSKLKNGDILINIVGASIGRSCLYNKDIPANINQAVCLFRCNSAAHNLYTLLYLSLPKTIRTLLETQTESARPNLSLSDISLLNFFLPPLPEQEKIADILGTWDEAIEKLSNLIEQKKLLKKGLMQKLLTGKTRLSTFTQPWKEVKLGEICNITTGKLDANAMVENGQYKFFTCAKEIYLIDNYAFNTEALLISGNGANVGYIHYYKGKFNAYQRTYVLDKFTLNIFLVKYLLDQFLSNRIEKEKKAGNTPYIVLDTLAKMKLYLPIDISEQQAIADVLSTADDEINLLNQKLEALKEQKKGLMQQLLTGQVRVKVN